MNSNSNLICGILLIILLVIYWNNFIEWI